LKEEALDRTMWRNRFGRGFGPVVWQITDDDDHGTWRPFYRRLSVSLDRCGKSRHRDSKSCIGLSRSRREAEHSPRFSAEVKNLFIVLPAAEYLFFLAFRSSLRLLVFANQKLSAPIQNST